MATRVHSKSVLHMVDEFDFSGVSNNCDIAIANTLAEATAFADSDKVYLEGKASFNINVGAMFSTASPNIDGEMFTDLTAANRIVGVYPPGIGSGVTAGTKGNYGYEGYTNVSQQARVAQISQAIGLTVGWKGTDPLIRSVLMDVDTAVGATANGTAYQRGAAASTDTIVGVLRLLAAPGGAGNNTLDVVIASDSAENFAASPETQLTFTQLDQTSTASFEIKTAAGAVTDTWWRVEYTYAGAGSRTFSLIISFGIMPT
jgi:hypothetical protein